MKTPPKYSDNDYNPEYVDFLEKKIIRIKSVITLAEKWSKDQSNGLTDSSICLSALKDIKRILKL